MTTLKTKKTPAMKSKTKKVARFTIPVIQVRRNGKKVKTFKSLSEAAAKTGVNVGSISKVVRGLHNTAGGFHWFEKN